MERRRRSARIRSRRRAGGPAVAAVVPRPRRYPPRRRARSPARRSARVGARRIPGFRYPSGAGSNRSGSPVSNRFRRCLYSVTRKNSMWCRRHNYESDDYHVCYDPFKVCGSKVRPQR
jgi:hypothetical protein